MAAAVGLDQFQPILETGIPYFRQPESAGAWFAAMEVEIAKGFMALYAVSSVSTDEFTGAVRLRGHLAAGACQLSFWIAKPCRNRGYCTSAVRQVVAAAYHQYGESFQISSAVHVDNSPSLRVLLKTGFQPVFRQNSLLRLLHNQASPESNRGSHLSSLR